MFSVLFEVLPKSDQWDAYLGYAKMLRPELEQVDGFVDNIRYKSLGRERWILSLSNWRDEKSVVRWRTEGEHHAVQGKGRFEIFSDYHLRVGDVTADTNPPKEAPVHERRFDETEVGAAKVMTFTEITPAKDTAFAVQTDLLLAQLGLDPNNSAVVEHDIFASIYNPGKLALLVAWKDPATAEAWSPKKIDGIETLRHRKIRVVRDYGRFDRREAPQFYPDVKGGETKHPAPAQR